MTKTLKRSCAALLSLAMILSMLLYYPSGIWDPISFGLTASAAVDTTPTQPGSGDGSAESPYEIGTVGELYWFAGLVNGTLEGVTQNTSAHGKLTADITVNTGVLKADGGLNTGSYVAWAPIGSPSQPYTGSFNGNKHVVSGLYAAGYEGVGFFGAVSHSTIAKLGVQDSYFKGTNYVGGICGRIAYSTIIDCFANCCVVCSNAGAGICGYAYGGSIYNCFNLGLQGGRQGICAIAPALTAQNCYYLEGTPGGDYGTVKTAEQFASGEVAYLLSEGQDDSGWGQSIGTDSYPVLGGAKVYKNVLYAGCNDTTTVLATSYSNTEGNVYGDHGTYENGFCSVCGAYEPAVLNADNVYEISNAGQLYWFAGLVNGTLDGVAQNVSANAVLIADITINENVLNSNGELNEGDYTVWTPIGTESGSFSGEFDGKNHCISGLYCSLSPRNYVGLFGHASHATIQNLGVRDSYFYGVDNIGSICGYSIYNTIRNCFADSYVNGSNCYGGVCGYAYGGSISNCFNLGLHSGLKAICGIDVSIQIENCYYLEGTTGDDNGTVKTAEQFASGEVAYLLDKDGGVWGQNIGTDSYPVLGGAKVYKNVLYAGCNDTTTVLATSYSNTEGNVYGDHGTYENGFCSVCGAYEPAVLNADNVYEISNAGQLYWFAGLVNGTLDGVAQNVSANAVLIADITINENVLNSNGELNEGDYTAWTPIGTESGSFSGEFDGRNHSISGLYFDDTSANFPGLFGCVANSMIQNVGLTHSYVRGGVVAGGICGSAAESSFEQCYTEASLIAAAETGGAGGIVGAGDTVILRNCYNSSTVSGLSMLSGGIVGCKGGAGFVRIVNCYSCGIANSGESNTIGLTNCYVLEDGGTPLEGETAKTEEEFASGEVAYLLSEGEGGEVWGQNIGTDAYPVLGGKKVFRTSGCVTYNNDGNDGEKAHNYVSAGETVHKCSDCGAEEEHAFTEEITSEEALYTPADCLNAAKYYKTCEVCGAVSTNAQDLFEDGEPLEHPFNENGFCSVCDAYEPAVKNANGAYEIGNAGQLYWFAGLINGTLEGVKQNRGADAVLTTDIVVNENVLDADGNLAADTTGFREWVPIGDFYSGIFDGQGHAISGLYFNDSTAEFVGLFGRVIGYDDNEYNIKGVGVVKSYIRGMSWVGAICGNSRYASIERCYTEDSVITGASCVGGICGWMEGNTIRDCYNGSQVSGESEDVGGICGYTGGSTSKIQNCCNYGISSGQAIITWSSYVENPIQNCYALEGTGTTAEGITTVSAEQFASGEVAYQLSQNTDSGVWGQNIGTDAYPVLGGKKVFRTSGCVTYNNDGNDGEKAHNYVSAGETVHKCSDCGAEEEHAFTEEIASEEALYAPAACLIRAKYYKSCEVCGAVSTNAQDLFEYGEPLGHPFNDEGFCDACGAYEPAEQNADGFYEIGNAGQLYWFAGLVNGTLDGVAQNVSANAVLTADITVNENLLNSNGELNEGDYTVWTPIGTESGSFSGEFDGKNHCISGLYCSLSPQNYVGLFGHASLATIQNLGVRDSYFYGVDNIGSICGYSVYNTIRNCFADSYVNGSNCYGGVCGYAYDGSISNCFNLGLHSGLKAICGFDVSIQIENCYYLEGTTGDDNGTVKTAEQFASGEVAYLLDKDGGVWGQNIGADAYPVLGGAKVYSYSIYSTCDKSDTPTTGYSNTEQEDVSPSHSYLNGICRKCGYFRNNIGTNLAGYTVTLDGTIGVNFYMMLDPRVIADGSAYMLFTMSNGRSNMVHMHDAAIKTVDGEEYYVFTCPVAPKDMYSSIKAQFVTSSGETATYRFTVEEYANYILDNPDQFTTMDAQLVTAMLQYGRYAEAYFAGETLEAPENMSSVSPDALPNSEAVITGELPEGITYYGTSLVLESELLVYHYFKVEESVTDIPDVLQWNQKGSYRFVSFKLDVGMGMDASVSVDDFTLEYYFACYVRKALESEQTPENLKHLVFAMYEYYTAAAAYLALT